MNKIIFISTLTLWSMGKDQGGPAFTQTVKKYIDEGWEVYLISDEPPNQNFPDLDVAHNISLPPTVFKRYGMLPKIGLLFRWMNHRVMNRRMYRAARVVRNGENAVLLTAETLPTLGGVLSELADDAALRERLGAAASAYAQEHFHTWGERMETEFQAVSALLRPAACPHTADNASKNAPSPADLIVFLCVVLLWRRPDERGSCRAVKTAARPLPQKSAVLRGEGQA